MHTRRKRNMYTSGGEVLMVKLFFPLSFQLLRYKGIPNSAGLSSGIWRYKAALGLAHQGVSYKSQVICLDFSFPLKFGLSFTSSGRNYEVYSGTNH